MRLLKRYRLSKGLTLTKLAGRLGVHVATVQAWEGGRNLPRPPMVPKLARVLEIDPMELTNVLAPEPAPLPGAIVR